jgi:demethylmenaquinone methyltransferase/2-methoxy-6-polyprenyl-1,4-benzoquinol methylase
MPIPSETDRKGVAPHPTLEAYYKNEPERRRFVRDIFDETAPDYDRIIRLMSFGSGAWYRWDALRRAGLGAGMKHLDVAVGTGAVAGPALRLVGPSGMVLGLDASFGMLSETRKNLPVAVVQGVAERLPFPDGGFDFVSMGYALRHVYDLRTTFAEYARVLKPGGKLLILDFCRPRTRIGTALIRFYMGTIVPLMAKLFSKSHQAKLLMVYCWDTVDACVPPETIREALEGAGFVKLKHAEWFGVFSEFAVEKP